jgi:hypothetical protein
VPCHTAFSVTFSQQVGVRGEITVLKRLDSGVGKAAFQYVSFWPQSLHRKTPWKN